MALSWGMTFSLEASKHIPKNPVNVFKSHGAEHVVLCISRAVAYVNSGIVPTCLRR